MYLCHNSSFHMTSAKQKCCSPSLVLQCRALFEYVRLKDSFVSGFAYLVCLHLNLPLVPASLRLVSISCIHYCSKVVTLLILISDVYPG